MIELASVVEFAVIALATAVVQFVAIELALAMADASAGDCCFMSWLGWSALRLGWSSMLCWRLIAGLRSMLLS